MLKSPSIGINALHYLRGFNIFTQIITFMAVYMFIGTLVAGYMIPKREWESPEEVMRFAGGMVTTWFLQLCVVLSLHLAEFFYTEDGE